MKALAYFLLFIFLATGKSFSQNLDLTFGENGIVLIDNESANLFPQSIFLDSLNRIYIAALDCNSPSQCNKNIFIYRLLSNGTIDQEFGNSGVAVINLDIPLNSIRIISSNDGIVLTTDLGIDRMDQLSSITLIDLEGKRKSHFGNGGTVYTSELETLPIRSVIELANHDFLIFGYDRNTQREVYKLDIYGSLDNNFGNNGLVKLTGLNRSLDYAYLNRDNASFTTIGILDSSGTEGKGSVIILEQFTFDGLPITSFGNNGIALSDTIANTFSTGVPIGIYHVIVKDSFIDIACNAAYSSGSEPSWNSTIARFGNNGDRIFEFGFNSLLPNPAGYLREFCRNEKGNLFTFGAADETEALVIYNYNLQGNLDASFGESGTLLTPVEASLPNYSFGGGLVQPDNKIIQYSINYTSETEFGIILARYNSSITSVNETGLFPQKIFPNPTQKFLYLSPELENEALELFNSQGQKFHLDPPVNSKLEVSHLQPGVYFLRAKERVWRFVKE